MREIFHGRKILVPIILIAVVIAAGVGFFTFKQNTAKSKPNTTAAAEIKDLTQKVGKLIELPGNEVPTIATVSDITKLKDQPFFAKAQNGDKVLVYQKAKKAILFRPDENKIIEVAIYNPPTAAQASATPSATSAKSRVALYNGTTIVGYTKTVQKDLESKVGTIEIVTRENAVKSDYKKTIVVDLSADKAGLGNNSKVVSDIAKALGGEVGSLPTGEVKPEGVDILVILGSNK